MNVEKAKNWVISSQAPVETPQKVQRLDKEWTMTTTKNKKSRKGEKKGSQQSAMFILANPKAKTLWTSLTGASAPECEATSKKVEDIVRPLGN